MAITLHAKRIGHFDAARLCNASYVIARQINQHDMFGALFGVVDQLFLRRIVQLRRGAARARARQRADGYFGLAVGNFLAHQNFRAGADHIKIGRAVRRGAAEVVVIHIGAGVERAQSAVQTQRRLGVFFLDALANLHLHKVATGNQFLGPHHRSQIVLFRKITHRCLRRAGHHCRYLYRLPQFGFKCGQACAALHIGIGHCRVHIDHEVQFPRQVVNHCQLFTLQEQDVWAADFIGRTTGFQLLLYIAHRVVTKVARQTTAKTWHARAQRHFEALLVGGNKVQRIACGAFHHHAIAEHFGLCRCTKTTAAQQGARRQADKTKTAKTLAAHHRLQQKAIGRITRQFQIKRKRRFQVRKGLGRQRDAIKSLARQGIKLFFGRHKIHLPEYLGTARPGRGICHKRRAKALAAGAARSIKKRGRGAQQSRAKR